MWFTSAEDLVENKVSMFNSLTIILLISFSQLGCQNKRVAKQLLPVLPWHFSVPWCFGRTWEGLFHPSKQLIIPIILLWGGRMALVTQSWFHPIPYQNCFSHCLFSSWVCIAVFKASFPCSSCRLQCCGDLVYWKTSSRGGSGSVINRKATGFIEQQNNMMRECYVMASCLSE